jgi:hypothetical protein
MKSDFVGESTGVASNGLLLSSMAHLLKQVDALPSGATGALAFGDAGVILVENKRICLALAGDMRHRLTDILCQQTDPPLARTTVEDVLRRCRRDGTSIGHALLSSGILSERELWAALSRHNCEAIARLSRGDALKATGFTPHAKCGYGARFVFSTTELLSTIAGKRRPRLATRARARLSALSLPDTSTFAFLREPRVRDPLVVACEARCDLTVSEVMELGSWASSAFELSDTVEDETRIMLATWCSRLSVVCWHEEELFYAAVCCTRAASAVLLQRLMWGPTPSSAPPGPVQSGGRP